jgi:hypothetical protein
MAPDAKPCSPFLNPVNIHADACESAPWVAINPAPQPPHPTNPMPQPPHPINPMPNRRHDQLLKVAEQKLMLAAPALKQGRSTVN